MMVRASALSYTTTVTTLTITLSYRTTYHRLSTI